MPMPVLAHIWSQTEVFNGDKKEHTLCGHNMWTPYQSVPYVLSSLFVPDLFPLCCHNNLGEKIHRF